MRTSGDKWFRVPKTPKKHGRIRGRVTPEELATLYHKEGLSLEDIAQRFRVTRQAVQLLLKTYGIPARGKSKARILALSKGKFEGRTTAQLNESLFSQWSQRMAYVLGYIFTDGSLCRVGQGGFRVSISSIDREHLEKLAAILGEGVPIEKRKQSKTGFSGTEDRYIHLISFTRPEMIADLRKLGLTERKSLTMQFPDVPEEFLRDFIRGCWDGDGSITGRNQFGVGHRPLVAAYVTGSLAFITGMRERLRKYGFGRLTIQTRQPDGVTTKNPSYSMKIFGGLALEFCRFLYDDVPDGLFLTRKFLTYKDFEPNLMRIVAAIPLRRERMRAGPSMRTAPASSQGAEAATSDRTIKHPNQCAATGRGWVCTFYRIPGTQFCAYHQPHAPITSPGV